jgi:hypothetical protein
VEKRRWRNTNKVVVSIKLSSKLNAKLISDAISQSRIPRRNYGIWVSLVTESDHDGVTVPVWICDLHERIGGKIDFSVTMV